MKKGLEAFRVCSRPEFWVAAAAGQETGPGAWRLGAAGISVGIIYIYIYVCVYIYIYIYIYI